MRKPKQPANKNNPVERLDQQSIVSSQQWSGPLPPPAALEHFNHIIPNGAERIVGMVEREQEHRMECEKMGLKAAIRDGWRGHILGGVTVIAAIAGAVFTSYIGAHPSVSVALVGLPVATIIVAFVRRK
jgi:uncharacterized membrane protein